MFRIAAAATALVVAAAFPSPTRAPARSRTHVVRIAAFRFAPPELIVAPGDTVVWRNTDILPHTSAADSGKWSSGELPPDSAFVLVTADTGRFPYHCAAHPSMGAVLIVR